MHAPKSGKASRRGLLLTFLGIIILTALFLSKPDILAVTDEKDPSWIPGAVFWLGFLALIIGMIKLASGMKFTDRKFNELKKH